MHHTARTADELDRLEHPTLGGRSGQFAPQDPLSLDAAEHNRPREIAGWDVRDSNTYQSPQFCIGTAGLIHRLLHSSLELAEQLLFYRLGSRGNCCDVLGCAGRDCSPSSLGPYGKRVGGGSHCVCHGDGVGCAAAARMMAC